MMYDPSERVIEVTDSFWVEINKLLWASERWREYDESTGKIGGLVMYVVDGVDGDSRKLVFRRKT